MANLKKLSQTKPVNHEASFPNWEKKFLLRIDHVFYLRMWKLRYVLKVGYMDLKLRFL